MFSDKFYRSCIITSLGFQVLGYTSEYASQEVNKFGEVMNSLNIEGLEDE